ncbi:RNA 2',3'-cyclic phosphodiesterase [Georgenia yuyongxinii]|uniref:RNA 2',3'-cyclic phosphodiesterase n=1 Tax=Georgenia yuyongxinii TaxID=2589797 RepID=A0A5B8C0W7_9MICO|nr:2'-5' RNA ligase family protein [Georgenia yuyongxinii]QDC24369.1 RNA 2',3'-cyclic phosphodiesterase [Georgenia yuyongxinii]
MRLFVALPLPAAVQEHLDLAVSALTDGAPDAPDGPGGRGGPRPVRWVPEEQRHITLAFFGEVPDGAAPGIQAALAVALGAFGPLRLRLRGAGVFSRRTLWVGVQEDQYGAEPGEIGPDGARTDRLLTLMARCEDVGEDFTRMERRDRHRAHVTLARLSARRPELDELAGRAHALSVYEGPPWRATHAELVSSRPGAGRSGGPLYEVVGTIPLGA